MNNDFLLLLGIGLVVFLVTRDEDQEFVQNTSQYAEMDTRRIERPLAKTRSISAPDKFDTEAYI